VVIEGVHLDSPYQTVGSVGRQQSRRQPHHAIRNSGTIDRKLRLETLRLQKKAEFRKQGHKTCSDSLALNDAVVADAKYHELISKDSHCAAILEKKL
jgi:hypothetical protein